MTDEEHKAIVVAIFRLFRQLPDLRSQVDLIGALGTQVAKKAAPGRYQDWLETGVPYFSLAARFMTGDPDHDGEKV